MNSITVAGSLTRDAEVKYLNSGDPVCNFSVADNQGRDKQAIFWNCQLWGKRAEALAPYLTKGQSVTVVGAVSEREYTDKNGNHRKSMDVRVNEIALQGGRRDAQEERRNNENEQQRQQSFEDDGSDVPF